MSAYPNAIQRPVSSHGGAATSHLGLILHVTTNNASPYGFFSNPDNQASSNFWVAADGTVEEYVDADLKAWAQSAGNGTYASVETSGIPEEALTDAQVTAVAALYAWGMKTYGWPAKLAENPGEPGLGWHGMGRAAWGGHTACPGDLRKAQRQQILNLATNSQDLDMTADELRTIIRQELATALERSHNEHVLILHGDKIPGSNRNSMDSLAATLAKKC